MSPGPGEPWGTAGPLASVVERLRLLRDHGTLRPQVGPLVVELRPLLRRRFESRLIRGPGYADARGVRGLPETSVGSSMDGGTPPPPAQAERWVRLRGIVPAQATVVRPTCRLMFTPNKAVRRVNGGRRIGLI